MKANESLKKIKWKYFVIGLVLPSLIYFGYAKFFQKQQITTSSGTVSTVTKGSIKETIKALGTTSIVNEQEIRFTQQGTVSKVNVKEGDTVKKGDIIAELDMTDLDNEIKQDEISLSNSKIALQELLNGNDKSQILSAEANVDSMKSKIITAQTDIANTKKEKEDKLKSLNATLDQLNISYKNSLVSNQNTSQDNQDTIDQAKQDLDNKTKAYELAKQDLENTKLVQSQSLTQSSSSYNLKITNSIQELKNGVIDGDNIMNGIDKIFGFTDANKTRVMEYDTYLGAKDSLGKTQTKSKYSSVDGSFDIFQTTADAYDINNTDIDKTKLIEALYSEKNLFSEMLKLCDLAYDSAKNSIATSSLSQSDIDGFLSTISSYRNTTQSRISNINSIISTIESLDDLTITQKTSDNTIQQKQQSVDSAKLSLDKAQQTYDSLLSGLDLKNSNMSLDSQKIKDQISDQKTTIQQTIDSYDAQIASKQYDLDNYQKQLETSQASLDETRRGATSESIKKAKNNIEQQELMIAKQKENVKNYQITAPFDGTILSIDFKVGDNLTSDDTKYVYIQNPNVIEVSVLLDQTDIIKVKAGLPVTMVFYSYPDETFTGEVSQISGIPEESSGVTSYKAKILLNTQGKTFYSGMTQTVQITIEEKGDVLLIPSLAISTSGETKTVTVVDDNGGQRSVTIATGLTDGTNTEITSGLTEGQKIMEKSYTSTSSSPSSSSSSSNSSSRSSTRSMGGMGGMGGGGSGPM